MAEQKKHFSTGRYWTIIFPIILLSSLLFGLYVLFTDKVGSTPFSKNVNYVRRINLMKTNT